MHRIPLMLIWIVAAGGLSLACKKGAPKPTPTAASSASAAPMPSAQKPKPPWYVGTWEGSYEAKLQGITGEPQAWQLPEWKVDKGEAGAGKGTLSLSIDKEGLAKGTSKGPLGELSLTGQVDEKKLRVQFLPSNPETPHESFQGFFIVEQKGEALSGTLNASSGNSRVVRSAAVTLSKKEP